MAEQPKHKGLYAALAAAQAEMGKALKDSSNLHLKSKYADLASVMDACMPALTKHGIAVLQPAYDDETGRYIKTVFVHGESGETVECRVPMIVGKNDMQGYGSAATYCRRYGLMGMAGIAPEDDDGYAAAKSPPRDAQPRDAPDHAPPPQEAIEAAINSLSAALDLDMLAEIWRGLPVDVKRVTNVLDAKDKRKAELQSADIGDAEIPY